jgi:hypothetical protein
MYEIERERPFGTYSKAHMGVGQFPIDDTVPAMDLKLYLGTPGGHWLVDQPIKLRGTLVEACLGGRCSSHRIPERVSLQKSRFG